MKPRAWLVLLILSVLPLAAATYGEGSTLEVDAPVTLEGRVNTWLPAGTASFVGSGASQLAVFHLKTGDATLIHRTLTHSCASVPVAAVPCTDEVEAEDRVIELAEGTITVTKVLSAYKIVATTDRNHADTPDFGEEGRLLITSATGTRLDTNREALALGMTESNWATQPTSLHAEGPLYQADAYSAQLTASTAALLRATGGFEAFFQGVQVSVSGVDADGEPVEETFDTRIPTGEREPLRALIVEVSDGDMQGSSAAPFVGYAPADQRPISDVYTRANFKGASGTVVKTDHEQQVEREDLSLPGPLSLTLTKITTGAAPRLSYALVDGAQLAAVEDPAENDPVPPAALAAAGALGAGGAGALLALAYFWPRLKFWATLLLIPMYTRIERDAVLQHEKRDELYELIRSAPGIHAHEIGEKAHIGWGTTVYHLKLLENHGLIVSKKSGRYKRFFVNTGEYTKKKEIYGALRNETAKAVAQYVVDHPGTTQKDLCAALGIQPSLASWHVEKLEGVELVKRVKDGRMVRYFAGPAWADLNVRVDPMAPGADTPAET